MQIKNNIKVSIVVPVYNVAPYLPTCLDSLINQTLIDIEIILIDDCSTDGSIIICEEYASNDPRIKLIKNEKNLRQGLSRNKGMKYAKGAYIGFVDPDDWISFNFYELLYNATLKETVDIAKAGCAKVSINGKIHHDNKVNKIIKDGLNNGIPLFQLFFYEHTTAIYKREMIIQYQIEYPDIIAGEDNLFLMKVTFNANGIQLVNRTWYYYRVRHDSSIHSLTQEYFDSLLKYFRMSMDFINHNLVDHEQYKNSFYRIFMRMKNRYNLLQQTNHLAEYQQYYILDVLRTVAEYKYDKKFILDNLFQEVTFYTSLKYCKIALINKIKTLSSGIMKKR